MQMNFEVAIKSSHRRNLVEACVKFFIKELGLERSRYCLTVMSEKGLKSSEDAQGIVFRIDERELAMLVDSRLSYKDLVETIAHEMVHVRQMARGTLKTAVSRGKTHQIWRGKKMRDVAYHRRPWEIEAFQLERLLVNNFVYDLLGKIK
jgi:hypothetical protein